MEVIILAGGFGTRLQSVVKDVPKPMADINGKPFLEYLLNYLSQYNITNVVLSVGYKQDTIKNYFKDKYNNINLEYSCEEEPLGTGGAIKQAIGMLNKKDDKALVINGDTFFQADLSKLIEVDTPLNSDITLCLKEMINFDRYGSVKVDSDVITKFEEKKFYKKAYINCGVYVISKNIFTKTETLNKFSLEEFLETNLSNIKACSYISNDSYFIDIGIPDDYAKAKIDFKEIF